MKTFPLEELFGTMEMYGTGKKGKLNKNIITEYYN